jgi:hypothetical protein
MSTAFGPADFTERLSVQSLSTGLRPPRRFRCRIGGKRRCRRHRLLRQGTERHGDATRGQRAHGVGRAVAEVEQTRLGAHWLGRGDDAAASLVARPIRQTGSSYPGLSRQRGRLTADATAARRRGCGVLPLERKARPWASARVLAFGQAPARSISASRVGWGRGAAAVSRCVRCSLAWESGQ